MMQKDTDCSKQNNDRIIIFVATHVAFEPPQSPIYVPLHVGREGKQDLGYLGDNVGENISDLNFLYGELTGLYWIWQNVTEVDYAGLCHYRRYFLNHSGYEMQRNDYLNLLQKYDLIVPQHFDCEPNYRIHYGRAHNVHDLEAVEKAVAKLYPDYFESFQRAMNGNVFYGGNLCVMSLALLKAYAEWLFKIFAEASMDIDVSGYDAYHRRVYGFLSEQMLYVFLLRNNLSYVEVPVGILGEKAETAMLKSDLAGLISQGKLEEAQKLFERRMADRPDMLLPGSDVYDELHFTEQVLHLCLLEKENGKSSLLDYSKDLKALILHYKKIRMIVMNLASGKIPEEDKIYLEKTCVSKEVLNEILRCKWYC